MIADRISGQNDGHSYPAIADHKRGEKISRAFPPRPIQEAGGTEAEGTPPCRPVVIDLMVAVDAPWI